MKKERYKVVFVVRGGGEYGMGHLVRSLSLGRRLAGKLGDVSQFLTIANTSDMGTNFFPSIEWPVRFINFENNGDLEAFARCWRKIDADVTILDYLDVSEEEKRIVSSYSDKIIFFDDMEKSDCQREICHVVIQCQNCEQKIFHGPVEENGILYLRGPRYFVLHSEFDELIRKKKRYSGEIGSVFVSIGGSNYQGAIFQITEVIRKLYKGIITVAGGFDPDERKFLHDSLSGEDINVLLDNKLFPIELFNSDLAVIAGGFTKYEAAALGVPSLILGFEEHQEMLARKFEVFGCGRWLGMYGTSALERMREELIKLISDNATRHKMGERGRELIPKNGAEEVVVAIADLLAH